MKTIRAALILIGLAGCTQLQGRTALEAVSDNALCVAQNFDLPWQQVIVKCGLRGNNLDYLQRLWASSRATAQRGSEAGARWDGSQ